MYNYIKSILNQNVKDKVVLVRADLNIPTSNGIIQDISRVVRLMPTINFLLNSYCLIVLVQLRLDFELNVDARYLNKFLI